VQGTQMGGHTDLQQSARYSGQRCRQRPGQKPCPYVGIGRVEP
jgi:hypothetical protein